MMEWLIDLSCFLTNALRIFLGLHLVAELLKLAKPARAIIVYALVGSALVTGFAAWGLFASSYILGAEAILLVLIARRLLQAETRRALYLIVFYEIGVALWEFLIPSWLSVLFRSNLFADHRSSGYAAAIWLVRLLMIFIAFLVKKKEGRQEKEIFRLTSAIAILGLFGVIGLSEQASLAVSDDTLTTWSILSVILMTSILFFNLSRRYEMEKEIARLKTEQAEFLERDYRDLNKSYSANAKVYHDLHNHIEALHGLLIQGKTGQAVEYLEDLRGPVREITQSRWTGDEAVDYLINSKVAQARQECLQPEVNIEFPRNTNIRSIDLAIILGNLLDNALEAAQGAKDEFRFLRLTLRRINRMLVVKVENGYLQEPVILNGEPQTTKENKRLHGWGLKSARAAVERYDGTIDISSEGGIFRAVATLFY